MSEKFAAIDTGTNTILMLIAEINPDGALKILRDEHSIARLGENVDKTGFISPEALERGIKIMRSYKAICRDMNVGNISACATSAVRDSANRNETAAALSEALGAPVKIIDGESEARLSFTGSVETEAPSSLIDIGGGSTEFIAGENGQISYRRSLNFGALRLMEKFSLAELPQEKNIIAAKQFILKNLEVIPPDTLKGIVYSVAGTPVTIASIYQGLTTFNYDKVHLFELTNEIVNQVYTEVKTTPLSLLVEKYNINPKRADILLGGIIILQTAMEYFGLKSVKANAKGLRYGILKEMANNFYKKA